MDFKSLIDDTLQPFLDIFAIAYLEYILIYSNRLSEY
jgi:hypothetical protein